MKSWLDRLVICKIVSRKCCVWYFNRADSLKAPDPSVLGETLIRQLVTFSQKLSIFDPQCTSQNIWR